MFYLQHFFVCDHQVVLFIPSFNLLLLPLQTLSLVSSYFSNKSCFSFQPFHLLYDYFISSCHYNTWFYCDWLFIHLHHLFQFSCTKSYTCFVTFSKVTTYTSRTTSSVFIIIHLLLLQHTVYCDNFCYSHAILCNFHYIPVSYTHLDVYKRQS